MNAFENNLHDKFSDANISASSQKLYFSNLRRLNGSAPLTDFKFLDKPEVIAEKLKDYAPTTQRNFYIAIVSALNLGGTQPKHKKLYSKYYDMMLNKNKEVKEIKGVDDGTPFNMKYVPSRQIAGEYGVDVRYGIMSGMNPNNAIIALLQMRSDKLVSRDYVRREIPMELNVTQEFKDSVIDFINLKISEL